MKKKIMFCLLSLLFIQKTSLCEIPLTEQNNVNSIDLDSLSAHEIVALMNNEDLQIALAITACIPQITQAVEKISSAIKKGGRLIYIGAGSSGRLGVLDASECGPTFSAPQGQVIGIIAGGDRALREAIESIEDKGELAVQDLKNLEINSKDVVCGISASGSAQYVKDALHYAKQQECFTILVTCNPKDNITNVDCLIAPKVGPEVLAGSTRLKAGTATKMVLNMLTTASYVLLGKVYKNYMVDLQPLNQKLIARAQRILQAVLLIDEKTSVELLEKSNKNVKTAIIMHSLNLEYKAALELLKDNNFKPLHDVIN